MAYVRQIGLAEMRRLGMAHPDFVTRGWAVIEDDVVLDWYADRYAAQAAAEEINSAEDDR